MSLDKVLPMSQVRTRPIADSWQLAAEWAREELNLRPHAYQALLSVCGIRQETCKPLIDRAICRTSFPSMS